MHARQRFQHKGLFLVLNDIRSATRTTTRRARRATATLRQPWQRATTGRWETREPTAARRRQAPTAASCAIARRRSARERAVIASHTAQRETQPTNHHCTFAEARHLNPSSAAACCLVRKRFAPIDAR